MTAEPLRAMAVRDGLLATFQDAGVLGLADVHVARRIGRLAREESQPVLLAAALAVRAARLGSVCVELRHLREVLVEGIDPAPLPWPPLPELLAGLRASPLVVGGLTGGLRPLRLVDTDDGELLYLDRYWQQEQGIRQVLAERDLTAPDVDADLLRAGLGDGPAPDRQRIAAALAVSRWTTVIAGGPGTGKTFTIARLLRLLQAQDPGSRIALAAPTGKAAARLQEEVAAQGIDLPAMTLHRLLGWRPHRTRFRHNSTNRLPYDLVVVDECSMVSLTLMARLMEAVRPDARLVLVGDPDQLASVDAGAVLADLIARPAPTQPDSSLTSLVAADLSASDDRDEVALTAYERARLGIGVIRLSRGRRFGGAIAELAVAVRNGAAEDALAVLTGGGDEVSFVSPTDLAGVRADVVSSSLAVTNAAEAADAEAALSALERHRLLCAHREGPWGVTEWDRRAREWVGLALGRQLDPTTPYAGQPLLVNRNDYDAKVYNGDTGVVVVADGEDLVAVFARAGGPLRLHPSRLDSFATVYAMTIHRSQGSQYDAVTVVLPDEGSVLLTRELLYTAVTRARKRVRVVGTPASVRAGIERQVPRASGLRRSVTPLG